MKLTRSMLRGAALALLVMAAGIFCVNQRVLALGSGYLIQAEEAPKGDAIIVLGAYVSPEGIVSPMLEERLKVGYELYRQGKAGKIIVSGDHSRADYDEVNAMKQYYLDKNIPSADIFMDHAGFTTYESMYRAKHVFGVNRAVIVSQKFHLPRAIFIARELGLEAYGVEAATGEYGQSVMLSNHVRETAARCKAFITALIKPEPTFLGEVMPVSGSGTVTDDKRK